MGDAKGRCCSCKATSDGVDPTMPGSEECTEEAWDTCGSETRVPVVLGGPTQVGPPSEISAGSSTTTPCATVNPAYTGDIVITCTKYMEVLADVSGCIEGSSSSPTYNYCRCSAGQPAEGPVCPSMGAFFCMS